MQNFGKIKNSFNDLLVESIVEKNGKKKKLFQDYIKTINENKILKTQFLVYTNIETKVESDINKASQFVSENISLFNKFKKKDIELANEKLNALVGEAASETNELHENITKLIFTNKTPETIDTIIEATDKVVQYILNNKPKVVTESIELPSSMLSTLMVDKYNEKYSTLTEDEKQLLRVLIDSDDEGKKNVHDNMIKECIELINKRLNTNDLEEKGKLLMAKEKLLSGDFKVDENFQKNLSSLMDLKLALS